MNFPPHVLASLLREEGTLLEYVKATVTAEQLYQGVDLLRTNDNEITFIAGHIVEDQVWQSVRVSSEDPSVSVALSVGERIVGAFLPDAVRVTVGRQRLAKMILVTHGSVVRATARSASAAEATTARIVLEIFGWSLTQEMLSTIEDALRLAEAS
jgi:hypothetical protein